MPKITPHRVENGTALKRCSKCKDWKQLGEYHKDKGKWDGFQSACKKCGRAPEYYEKNKVKLAAKQREYREKNKAKISDRDRKYREKNKTKWEFHYYTER